MSLSKLMTIQDFSERTGISKSALRYYESKNLLHSVGRNSSGYRVYSDNQIAIVKLITSLRLADVPIKEIKAYLKEKDEIYRQNIMVHWIKSMKKRIDILTVGLRYLESDSTDDQFFLFDKAAETIIWFSAESETGKFRKHVMKRMKELEKLNIPIKSCYLKYISGEVLIQANVGFGIPDECQTNGIPEGAFIEKTASCICIALSFNEQLTKIDNGYRKLIIYANENNWLPTGSILEWYRGDDFTDIDLLMPVTKMEKREGMDK